MRVFHLFTRAVTTHQIRLNLTSTAEDTPADMAVKAPPPGSVDLTTAQNAHAGSLHSVIGVVVDYLPPKQNYAGDYQATFKLRDLSMRYSGDGLKVRFFKKHAEELPPIKAIGDVVLLRQVKTHEFQGEIMLIATYQTAHLVFSGAVVPSPAFKLDYVSGNGKLPCQGTDGLRSTLGPVEQDYIITLKHELNIQAKAVDTVPLPPVGPRAPRVQRAQISAGQPYDPGPYSRKFKLVKDLQHRVFSDVCVEVVKKFTTPNGNCELYVTDYTANNQMFYYAAPGEKHDLVRDGDQFGYNGPPKREWPGPYGFLVLKVNLSEPHASFATHRVGEGQLIALENVKIKLMPNNTRLEGDMWPDQNDPSKVQIRPLHRSRNEATDLLLRKDEYWAARRATKEKVLEAEKDAAQSLTKRQKKRNKKLKRQQRAEEDEAAAVK
jgi:protection-of-telomeres protein 1